MKQPGDEVDIQGGVESSVSPPIGQNEVLPAGEYIIYVPPGQRAIVRYEIAVTTNEGDDDEPHDSTDGVVFGLANDGPG